MRLLPAFDVYVAGTRPKGSLVEKRFEESRVSEGGMDLVRRAGEGKGRGSVGARTDEGRIEVTVQPFRKFAAAQKREIHEDADRLGRFLGAPAAVTYRE